MSRLAMVMFAVSCFTVGCGANPQTPADTPVERAREACYWLSEGEFGEQVATFADMAAFGWTRSEILALWTSGDNPIARSQDWLACVMAKLDLVYGR